MKKTISLFCLCAISLLNGVDFRNNITGQIPQISQNGFRKIGDVAHYKMADWSQVVGMARSISLDEAFIIAKSSPHITFFFYTKGAQMILEKEDGSYRVFHRGDTVFFTGEPWWGSAPGLADGYVKEQ